MHPLRLALVARIRRHPRAVTDNKGLLQRLRTFLALRPTPPGMPRRRIHGRLPAAPWLQPTPADCRLEGRMDSQWPPQWQRPMLRDGLRSRRMESNMSYRRLYLNNPMIRRVCPSVGQAPSQRRRRNPTLAQASRSGQRATRDRTPSLGSAESCSEGPGRYLPDVQGSLVLVRNPANAILQQA